ncbi:MAG: hypothetical protein GY940_24345 [bacterium]|nr:hypothetical protein [bacterium]
MTQQTQETLGEDIIQDEGEGMEQVKLRQEYYGPVFLTSFIVSGGASIFYVDDPNKLPEHAVAVRVPPYEQALASMLSGAMHAGKPVSVVPGHRWHLGQNKIAWTIWKAKNEY